MDILLIILGILCLIVGLAGCILPMIPGPPVAYAGLLLLHFTDKAQFSTTQLLLWLAAVVLVQILDYFVPMLGSKYSGGSRWGNARLPHRHHRRVVLHALGHHPRPLSRSLCRRTDGRQQDRPGLEIGAGLAAWILAGHSSEMCDVCVLLLGVRQSLGLTPAPLLLPGNNLSPDHLPHGSPSA